MKKWHVQILGRYRITKEEFVQHSFQTGRTKQEGARNARLRFINDHAEVSGSYEGADYVRLLSVEPDTGCIIF